MRWMRRKDNLKNGLLDFIEYLDLKNANMTEIGSYTGESVIMFANSNKFFRINAIDPWKNGYDKNDIASKQVSMDKIEELFDKNCNKYSNIITKIKMTSSEAVHLFDDKSLDLVYIDGCHIYDHVVNDITLWKSKIKSGGYISGHDYYCKDKKKITDVKKAVDGILGLPDKTFIDNSWVIRI